MNYIKALKATVAKQHDEIDTLREGINDVLRYLNSSKFHGEENNFVNPNDIRLRISEVINQANEYDLIDIETDKRYNMV